MPDEFANSPLFKYLLSCCAATVAETVTYPLDLTKTRLQIQGERDIHVLSDGTATSVPRRGMFAIAYGVVREEGVLKLWDGLTPAILRHFLYTGIRVGVYEQLREHLFSRKEDGTFPLWKALISGGLGGALAQLVASPTDFIKVQMQTEGYRRVRGHPPRVHGIVDAVRKRVKESGIRGLWRGWVPNVQRAALVNMADLATYDKCKHMILRHSSLKDNYVTHALSSLVSGLAAAIVSTPTDVVKTRIMNQPSDAKGRGLLYTSSANCLMQTVKQEGFFALYKGFVPIWARMAPWSLTFWVSYEQVRKLAGTASF